MTAPDDLGLLAHFDRGVLAYFRAEAAAYRVVEDKMGGHVETVWPDDHDADSEALPNWHVRFAFRALADGGRTVAAFGPDLAKLPTTELRKWSGHHLEAPAFATEDPGFEAWVARNFEGSWDVEDGPRFAIEHTIRTVNALTTHVLGESLFRWEEHERLNYPIAENTEAYSDAVLRLYQLVVDGLQCSALGTLARHLGRQVSDQSKTLNSLREVLPARLHSSVHKPLKQLGKERGRVHGVRSARPQQCEAFAQFHSLLHSVDSALSALKEWLEDELGSNAASCLERAESMKILPEICGLPRPAWKLAELAKAEGATIARVEFGAQKLPEGCPPSEAVVLHFTDGSALGIEVGSNAGSVAAEHEGMKREEFETDIIVFWVPPAREDGGDSADGVAREPGADSERD